MPEGFAMRARWRCARGLRGARVSLAGLEGSGAQFAVRARFADGVTVEETLDDARRAVTLPTRARPWAVAGRYFVMGARHIAEGADLPRVRAGARAVVHVAPRARPRGDGLHARAQRDARAGGAQVLARPSAPGEACIALSVLVVALDVAKGRAPPERGWAVTAAVGALHGLGFAGALREAGLPAGAVVPALGAFNVGVEAGQLVFIAMALAVMALLKRARVEERVTRRWVTDALGAWSVMLLLQRVW
ncbi:MAG: HupE/UreJ family protein [Polyangiales bacterium]